jgi:hypothetical protein
VAVNRKRWGRATHGLLAFTERGIGTMMHEEFAERFAERLEACADALEQGGRPAGQGATATRATELRTAAAMAREEAAAVTEEEAPPPEAQA